MTEGSRMQRLTSSARAGSARFVSTLRNAASGIRTPSLRRVGDEEAQLEPRQADNPLWNPDMHKVRSISMEELDQEQDKRCGRVRHALFGSRKKRIIFFTSMTVLLSLLTFLGVRASQALKITETSPKFSKVTLNQLCSNKFAFSVEGTMENPAVVGATLKPTVSEVRTEDGIVGYLSTPEIPVESGTSSLQMEGTFEICDACLAPLQKAMQRYLDGYQIDYSMSLELAAAFDASVFLFPITFSTTMAFDTFLEPYFDRTLNFEERQALALEAAKRGESRLVTTALLSSGVSEVEAEIGLNMTRQEPDEETRRRNEEEGFGNWALEVEVPALTFTAEVDDRSVAVGSSKPFVYGGKDLLMALVKMTRADVPGVNEALVKYQKLETMSYNIVGKYDKSLLSSEDATSEECFLQKVIEGVALRADYEFFPKVIEYQEEVTKNDPSPVSPQGAKLTSVNENGVFQLLADVDMIGTKNYYMFQGTIPPLGISMSVNTTSVDAREDMGTLTLTAPLVISEETKRFAKDVPVVADLDNIITVTQFVQQAAGLAGGYSPSLFMKVIPDESLLSALLQTYVIQVPFNVPDSGAPSVSERLLAQSQDDKVSLNVRFNVTDEFLELDIVVDGADKEFLLGYQLAFDETDLTLATYPFQDNTTSTKDFFNAHMDAFDVRSQETDTIRVSFRLFPGSEQDNLDASFLSDLIERLFIAFELLELDIQGSYSVLPSFISRNMFQVTNWDQLRADHRTVGDNSDGSALIELSHMELDGLSTNVFRFTSFLQFNVDNLVADLVLPKLRLGLVECSEPSNNIHLLNLETSETEIVIKEGEPSRTQVGLGADFSDTRAVDVLTSAAKWFAGNASTVCVVEHSEVDENDFLSRIIAAFRFSVQLTGLSEEDIEDATEVAESSELDLAVLTDDNSVCVNINVNLTDANSNWATSFGWGDQEWSLAQRTTLVKFFSVSFKEAFVGATCSSPWATPASCGKNNVAFSFCFDTDNADLELGAENVRKIAESIVLDQLEVPIKVDGLSKNRRNPQAAPSIISAEFNVPEDALSILQGSSVKGDSATSSFDLGEYVSEISLLQIVDLNAAVDVQAKEPTGYFGSIRLTIPAIETELFTKDSSNLVDSVLFVNVNVPQRSDRFQAAIAVQLLSWKKLFDTVVRLRDEQGVNLVFGRKTSPPNFMNRLLPRFELTESSEASSLEEEVITPSLNMLLTATSTKTQADLIFLLDSIDDFLPVPFKWFDDDLVISDLSKASVGTVAIPAGGALGPKGLSSGEIKVHFEGDAALGMLEALFRGNDVPLAVSGRTGKIQFEFTLPKELVQAVALGTEESSSGASEAISLRQFNIMGGDTVGTDVVLPCLVAEYCNNLEIDESKQAYTGITFGFLFSLPDLQSNSSLQFTIDLQSDLEIDVLGNGLKIGKLSLLPFKLESSKTGPNESLSAMLRIDWNAEQVETARFVIARFTDSESLVVSLLGSVEPEVQYVSKLLAGIQQDLFFESKAADPNAPALFSDFDLTLENAFSTRLGLSASTTMNYLDGEDGVGVYFPLGSLNLRVYHLNQHVVTAFMVPNSDDGRSFIIEPKPVGQPVTVKVDGYRNQGPGPVTDAINSLMQRYVFPDDIQVRLEAEIVPPREASIFNRACDSSRVEDACKFTLKTWLTYPKNEAASEFIDNFAVNMGATIGSATSFDIAVSATKTLKNSLPFPIIVSHFRYKINMVDTDGTSTDNECRAILDLPACYESFLLTIPCQDPFPPPGKQNLIQDDGYVLVGDTNRGAKSLLKGGKVFLEGDSGTGDVDIKINPLWRDLVRMWDEYNHKNLLCADIADARMIIGFQDTKTGCSDDPNTPTENLACTFVLDLSFQMLDYALTDTDSCQGPLGAQENLYNPITISTGYDWRIESDFFETPGSDTFTMWSKDKVSASDPLKIILDADFGGNSEIVQVIFAATKTSQPLGGVFFNTDGCHTAGVIGSQTQSKALLETVTGGRSTIEITFDSYTQRVRMQVGGKYADFDLDRSKGNFAGVKDLWVGVTRNKASALIRSVTTGFDQSDASKASLVKGVVQSSNLNPRENQIGFLTFQNRDKQGRKRGAGGEIFEARFVSSETGAAAEVNDLTTSQVTASGAPCVGVESSKVTCSAEFGTCVCDLDNGTYRVVYNIPKRGRYTAAVRSSTTKFSPNAFFVISERIFIRQ